MALRGLSEQWHGRATFQACGCALVVSVAIGVVEFNYFFDVAAQRGTQLMCPMR
jgi:hypothetical protein